MFMSVWETAIEVDYVLFFWQKFCFSVNEVMIHESGIVQSVSEKFSAIVAHMLSTSSPERAPDS